MVSFDNTGLLMDMNMKSNQTEDGQTLWTKDFIGITVINFLIFCGFQMLMPTLPIYVKSIGGVDSVIGWISGTITISALLVRPFSGIALDRFGRKSVYLVGISTIILVTLAYAWFPIVGLILAIRFLHGFGWGTTSTASTTIATDIIPKKRLGEGIGFFSLSTSMAMALAPAFGLYVLSTYNITGLTLFSASFTAAALLLSLFISYRPSKKERPNTKVALYEPSAISPSFIMFFVTASYGAITGFISLYGMECGISNIGAFFTVYAFAMLFSRPFFGKMIDRFGFNAAMYPGLLTLIASMLAISKAGTLSFFLLAAFLYGIGFGAVQSSLHTISVTRAPRDRLGAANATYYMGFDGGIGFGSVAAGFFASLWGYSNMYLAFSIFLIIATVLYFLLLGRTVRKA